MVIVVVDFSVVVVVAFFAIVVFVALIVVRAASFQRRKRPFDLP